MALASFGARLSVARDRVLLAYCDGLFSAAAARIPTSTVETCQCINMHLHKIGITGSCAASLQHDLLIATSDPRH